MPADTFLSDIYDAANAAVEGTSAVALPSAPPEMSAEDREFLTDYIADKAAAEAAAPTSEAEAERRRLLDHRRQLEALIADHSGELGRLDPVATDERLAHRAAIVGLEAELGSIDAAVAALAPALAEVAAERRWREDLAQWKLACEWVERRDELEIEAQKQAAVLRRAMTAVRQAEDAARDACRGWAEVIRGMPVLALRHIEDRKPQPPRHFQAAPIEALEAPELPMGEAPEPQIWRAAEPVSALASLLSANEDPLPPMQPAPPPQTFVTTREGIRRVTGGTSHE